MRWVVCAALAAQLWLAGSAWADQGDDRFIAARDAAGRGDTQKLAALVANPTDHVLEPYIQYWLLSARIARTSEAAPAEAIADFLQRNAGSLLGERLRQEWARRLAREGRWPQFEAEYLVLGQPDQDLQCSAIMSGGAAAIDAQRALESQWLTLLEVPGSCAQVLHSLADNGRFTSEDIWQRFHRLVENKRFTAARQLVEWLPDGQQPNAAALAAALDNPTRFLASAAARNLGTRPAREIVSAALVRVARSDVRDAIARWRAIDGAFRDDERAYMAGQLGWMAAIAQLPEALSLFNQARATAMSDEQRAWQVRAALRAGDWSAVRQAIEAMSAPQRDQAEWSYWLGRALTQQNRSAEARSAFTRHANEPTFYGILATEAMGQSIRWPAAPQAASAQDLARIRSMPDVRRSEALLRLNMRLESLREWNWGLRGADDKTILSAAEYARKLGLYDRAINTAERTREQHDYGLRYLAPYYETFVKQSRNQGLDPAWVYGLTRQESRFQPIARSGVGAQGLMQVMPTTGRWIAKKQGWSDYDTGWLTAIDSNVQVGCAYLRHVLDTLGNQAVVASAAYNAGPGRAKRWRDAQPMEGAIYAETIPITETRDYVKKVMANAVFYDMILNGRAQTLTKRLGKVQVTASEAPLDASEPQ